MIPFILQHQLGLAVAAYWIFSAAVSSLTDPSSNGNPTYLWLYRFCHTTAGNITTVFGDRLPRLKVLVPPLIATALLATPACAAYTVHPGAINRTDSVAYDTLLIAESAISQARADNQAHPLPPYIKDALNTLVASYDVARASWLTYHDTLSTNTPSDAAATQLNQNIADLTNAIRNLKTMKEVKQ